MQSIVLNKVEVEISLNVLLAGACLERTMLIEVVLHV